MKRIVTLSIFIVFLFSNWALAQELEKPVQSPAEKNLEALVEKYKAIKKDIQLKSEDALRLEGAIMVVQDMVNKEKAVKEVTALEEETIQQEEK